MKRKPSVRSLLKQNEELLFVLGHERENRAAEFKRFQAEISTLKRTVEDRLLSQRGQVLQQLGVLTEAVSKAIVWVVGKEQL